MPSREPASQLRHDWEELESQLPFNKSRTTVLHAGSLNVLQLGSVTLGKGELAADKQLTSSWQAVGPGFDG